MPLSLFRYLCAVDTVHYLHQLGSLAEAVSRGVLDEKHLKIVNVHAVKVHSYYIIHAPPIVHACTIQVATKITSDSHFYHFIKKLHPRKFSTIQYV